MHNRCQTSLTRNFPGFVWGSAQLVGRFGDLRRHGVPRDGAARGSICTDIVRRCQLTLDVKGFAVLVTVGVLAAGAAPAQPPPTDLPHREAAGWLELEADQRAYRERVEPLDLRQERELETIERRQRNDLRALQLRQRRELDDDRRALRRRRQEADVDGIPMPPRPGVRRDDRRQYERQRLNRQLEQRWLPFGRR